MMRRRLLYTLLAVMTASCIAGCDMLDKDPTKWNVTLKNNEKKPYGTYLAYQSLKYYFPGAHISELSNSYRYNTMSTEMTQPEDGKNLMVLAGLDLFVSDDEWQGLTDYVRAGNELVIFCSQLDEKIESTLGYNKSRGLEEVLGYKQYNELNGNQHVLRLTSDTTTYGYAGRWLKSSFKIRAGYSTNDGYSLPQADTLGYADGKPNVLRFKLGSGHLTIHAAPLVVSNYFLLQPGNIQYLTGLWQTLPENIHRVYWNEYFKHTADDSSFAVLMRYRSTRWALLLSVFTAAAYLLFQLKRRQRVIAIVAPLKNDSVSFVETVGRLYYNKGNHANLAEKMTQQFMEWVRMHYYLNTNLLSEEFAQQLTMKSGQPEAMVHELLEMIRDLRTGSAQPDDAYLYQLYRIIQQFYKNEQ